MTDFRALCVELTDCLEKADWPHRYKAVFQQWANIAHAALAESDGPAVPDGREPASVAEQPSDEEIEEWADACPEAPLEEMDPEVHGWRRCFTAKEFSETIRAALSRWGRPAAAPMPVVEPVAWLWEYIGPDPYPRDFLPVARSLHEMDPANPLYPDSWRPVAPLYLLPVAAPVPVSERLPGPEDCDAEGLCWWWDPECEQTEGWIKGLPEYCNNNRSHWLPANALPLPAPEGGELS